MNAGEGQAVRQSAYRSIIERIGEMIESGELCPGDRLPPERRLAERFSVSRTSLRQAFLVLAERGIIESRQGDGTYLLAAPDHGPEGIGLLEAISERSGMIADVLEFRKALEPQIAALAAERITEGQLDRLKVLVCDQQRSLLTCGDGSRFDVAFHRLLVTCTGNRVIIGVMHSLASLLAENRTNWLQSSERQKASIEGHLRIIDALVSKNADAARRAMEEHLETVGELVLDEGTGE